jgi:hypothetical protein
VRSGARQWRPGWILALRGLVLMAAPKLYERGTMSMDAISARVRCPRRDCFMWVGSPSLPHYWQRTTREANDAE